MVSPFHWNKNEKTFVSYLPYPNTCLRLKIKSWDRTFSTDLRHISVQHRKRFVFGVPIYVTHTDEINQNGSRDALLIEQAPYLKTRVSQIVIGIYREIRKN